MWGRSNTDIRLDYYYHLVNVCILRYQNISTGLIVNASAVDDDDHLLSKFSHWNLTLSKDMSGTIRRRNSILEFGSGSKMLKQSLPAIIESQTIDVKSDNLATESRNRNHSWVRDNIYSIMSVWGLNLAYRKLSDLQEGRARAYELEKAVVKTMRGLLCSMMMQMGKVEKFKQTQSPADALHAKYNSLTGKTIVGDMDWGHLQIDATSLFLLILAQMTLTGVIIIFTLDEVAFIQNLVFYIEAAYRTPDYGIWERGDKTNHGLPELNASSIGLAKAALEAISGIDLFGSRGGPTSTIHVMPDETNQCQAILYSMLPRESISKETDAALLTVIGFPAFAVDDPDLIAKTHKNVMEKLEGSYGCKRFLRDGYKTPKEDPHRLHYEPWELMIFENIECHWPMFFAYLVLDGLFSNNMDQVETYRQKLEEVMLVSEDGIPVVPELYFVPKDLVDLEYVCPNSQKREPTGRIPHMWSQSMYILGQLMIEGFISPAEIDPLNRRYVTGGTLTDVVVQVVILCEDSHIQEKMAAHGIDFQTVEQASPFLVLPGTVLSKIYKLMGKNRQIGLTGRSPTSDIGLLATSRLYIYSNKIMAFTPQVVDGKQFYLGLDVDYLVDDFTTKIDMLRCSWKEIGRPLLIYKLTRNALSNYQHPPNCLLATIKKLQTGFISGTRVNLGKIADFQHTSCVQELNFLSITNEQSGKSDKLTTVDNLLYKPESKSYLTLINQEIEKKYNFGKPSIMGIARRSQSIIINPEEFADIFSAQMQNRRQSRYFTGPSFHALPVGPSFHALPVVPPKIDDHETDDGSSELAHDTKSFENIDMQVFPFPTRRFEQLRQSDNVQEQADILHYLFVNKGPNWDTKIDDDFPVTVRHLLKELYDKAGNYKQWWLVRHMAGMLKKRVQDLALAATDLLVRQKHISVGLPPDNETIITSPLPPAELAAIIFQACGNDYSTASLTQELLVYLAMYIRTAPRLFEEMLRLRVGLIIQVMVTELSKTLSCTGDEATDSLMNLSPYEVKKMLLHILSGDEQFISDNLDTGELNIAETAVSRSRRKLALEAFTDQPLYNREDKRQQEEAEMDDRQGQWLRRRRLDGSLNRVPIGFYSLVWELLRKCHSLIIKGNILLGSLTNEMTKQEFKFALEVEMVLNSIPQPDYRQLMVEAMMVLTMLVSHDSSRINLSSMDIEIDQIVAEANKLFIRDVDMPPEVQVKSMGSAAICQYFYDLAPSGRRGSMSYISRALVNILSQYGAQNCYIS